MTETKFVNDASIRDLGSKLSVAEEEGKKMRLDVQQLRKDCTDLEAELHRYFLSPICTCWLHCHFCFNLCAPLRGHWKGKWCFRSKLKELSFCVYFRHEKSENQLLTRVAVLEQQVNDKDAVISNCNDLLRAEQAQKVRSCLLHVYPLTCTVTLR